MSKRTVAGIKMAMLWGVLLAAAGGVIGLVFHLFQGEMPNVAHLAPWVLFGSILGAIGGSGFAVAIALQSKAEDVDQLSTGRMFLSGALLGAIGGMIGLICVGLIVDGRLNLEPGLLAAFGSGGSVLGLLTATGIITAARKAKELPGGTGMRSIGDAR